MWGCFGLCWKGAREPQVEPLVVAVVRQEEEEEESAPNSTVEHAQSNDTSIKVDPAVFLGEDCMIKVMSFLWKKDSLYDDIASIGSESENKELNFCYNLVSSFYLLGTISPEWRRIADKIIGRLKPLTIHVKFAPKTRGYCGQAKEKDFVDWLCKHSFPIESFAMSASIHSDSNYKERMKLAPVLIRQCDTSALTSATLSVFLGGNVMANDSYLQPEKSLLEELAECPRLESLILQLRTDSVANLADLFFPTLFSNASITRLKIGISSPGEHDNVFYGGLCLAQAIQNLPALKDLYLACSSQSFLACLGDDAIFPIQSKSLKNLRLKDFCEGVFLHVDCPQLERMEYRYPHQQLQQIAMPLQKWHNRTEVSRTQSNQDFWDMDLTFPPN